MVALHTDWGWGALGTYMNSRLGKVVADCVDEVMMALTSFVLLIVCSPFEVCASILRFFRLISRLASRLRADDRGGSYG